VGLDVDDGGGLRLERFVGLLVGIKSSSAEASLLGLTHGVYAGGVGRGRGVVVVRHGKRDQ
jgi:hypothetical protein